ASFAMMCLVSGLGILILIFIPGDLIFVYLRNKRNKRLLKEIMEKGTQPDVDVSEDDLVLRPETIKHLKKILQPYERQSFYHLVYDEHGTGKNTLIRISSREVGRGVIDVDVPASLDLTKFGDAFGKTLNFTFEEHISHTKQPIRKIFNKTVDTLSKWERALDVFKREAEIILDVLQDDAKDNAADRKYVAVFVMIEIGDLSKRNHLINKRNIKGDAKKFYELVGGRIMDLKIVADKFIDGQSPEDIKNSILNEIEKKFNTARLLRKQLHHEIGKRVIHALLGSKNKELKFTTFMKYFNNYKEANEVLENNVFSYHPENNVFTFQYQSSESYIRENTDIFVNLIDLTPQEVTSSNQTTK
ncbi:10597_t:CDS:2, partial [Acaulospora colombiana]